IFCGFAYADVPDCGMSMVVVTDDDQSAAEQVARELSERAWQLREQLFKRELIHSVDSGLARAFEIAQGAQKPICLLEHADRLNDSTYTLRALIERGIDAVYSPFMFDPQSAERCIEVGAGARIHLQLAGKTSPQAGGPIATEAEVLWAGQKRITVSGPLYTGADKDLGACALVRIGGVLVSLISVQWSAIDLDCFTEFGLDPADFRYILLRSKTHFRHVYEPLCEAVIIIDTPDWGPADLSRLPYQHADRSAWPLAQEVTSS
ncbi:MAG: M81 family metallopeptidase, partial [Gammaproteobacteria bacterium]|nr:M81 family metallopeptidase [Gammaproteobacteria bacterium]